jgi:hypothetical protein
MLVGYPVDGVSPANQGRMFATAALNAAFTQVPGTDTTGAPYRVYTTSDLTSVGGTSGGPLCVQFDDSNYYPAAIYLGGSAQTVVRAIDGNVISLFNRAEVSANNGPNNTGGGIIQIDTPFSGTTFTTASLQVDLLPASAAANGASWKLSPNGTARSGSFQLLNLSAGTYTITFTPASGFLTPPTAAVTLTGGSLSTVTRTYHGILTQPAETTAAPGTAASFVVEVSGAATSFQWKRNGTPISGANAASYTKTGVTVADTGNYSVTVTWGTEGSLTSSAATLSVLSPATTFDSWRAQIFTTNELANPLSLATADFDGDGLSNLAEFALNLNPKLRDPITLAATGTSGLPRPGTATVGTEQRLTLEYVRRTAASNSGLTYTAEFNNTFNATTNWTVGGSETVTPIDATWERVKVTDQQTTSPTRSARLRIVQP